MTRRSRAARFAFFIPLAILAMIVFGWVVQLLWNDVAVPVLHVSAVTYWQGLGLLVLSKILFSSFGGRHGRYRGDNWKHKMMWNNMTPEQQEKFKEEWKARCSNWKNRSWNEPESTEFKKDPSM